MTIQWLDVIFLLLLIFEDQKRKHEGSTMQEKKKERVNYGQKLLVLSNLRTPGGPLLGLLSYEPRIAIGHYQQFEIAHLKEKSFINLGQFTECTLSQSF
jgi:hypothetical protein